MHLARLALALPLLISAAPVRAAGLDPALLSLDEARAVMATAQAFARAHGAPGGAIAVVDASGSVVLVERLDGTFGAAGRISIGKAQTAAAFRKPTRVFEDAINQGRTAMAALPDFYPLRGGVPLMRGDQFVGAVGVSGAASAQQDDEIAEAAAATLASGRAALASPTPRPAPEWTPATVVSRASDTAPGSRPATTSSAPTETTFVAREEVRRAFAEGRPLLENGHFKVHASRRDGPGQAEVHDADADIVYVLEGRAELVTGGRMLDAGPIGPGELRGPAIEGGQSRRLAAGDVLVIPAGTPHWFRDVSPPFLYYVVKVTGKETRS